MDNAYRFLIAEISARLAEVREEIARAAGKSGRNPEDIRLIAVTKTHPASLLQAAVQAGVTDIGENYLREAEEKFCALGWPPAGEQGSPVTRHAIGHIQSNKLRKAVNWFEFIHTVDSLRMARRISELACELKRPVNLLMQINISNESTKSGFFVEEIEGILPELANLTLIRVAGLMTIGRFELDPEAARSDFVAMRKLRDRLQTVAPDNIKLDHLSMGMSHDYAIAIEEGATMVRIGSRLFGQRNATRTIAL